MRFKKVPQLENGEPWVVADGCFSTHVCCSCKNTHQVYFEIIGDEIVTRWYEDTWETSQRRKRKRGG